MEREGWRVILWDRGRERGEGEGEESRGEQGETGLFFVFDSPQGRAASFWKSEDARTYSVHCDGGWVSGDEGTGRVWPPGLTARRRARTTLHARLGVPGLVCAHL